MNVNPFPLRRLTRQTVVLFACLGASPWLVSTAQAETLQVPQDAEVVLSPSEEPALVSHYAGRINPPTLQVGGLNRKPWGDGQTATLFQYTVPESLPEGSKIRSVRLIVTPSKVFNDMYPPTLIGLLTAQPVWDGSSPQIEVDTVEKLLEELPSPRPSFMVNTVKDPELSYEFDLTPWLDLTGLQLKPGMPFSVILWRLDHQGLRGATFYGSEHRDSEGKSPVLEIDY